MYKVIIVDDEERVRKGLCEFVDWDSLGFCVVETFASGEETFDFIVSHPVDVILTDIIMPPGMNGLELIEELTKIEDKSLKIVLSGHTEFKYAKLAIKLGAKGFLTKPVDFEELSDLFLNLKDDLDRKEIKKIDERVQEELAITQLLIKLISGNYDDVQSLILNLRSYNIHLGDSFGTLLRIRLKQKNNAVYDEVSKGDGSIEFIEEIKDVWTEGCKKIGSVLAFINERHEIIIIIDKKIVIEKSVITTICNFIEDKFDVLSYVGVANYSEVGEIDTAYLKTMQALSYRIIYGQYIEYDRISENNDEIAVIEDETKSLVIDYLYKKQFDELNKLLKDILVSTISISRVNINVVYNNCINLLLILNNYLIGYTGVQVLDENMAELSQSLYKADTVLELLEKLGSYFNKAYELINNHKFDNSGRIIEEIKRYINDHYEQNITLQMLADMKYIHPIYLSKLFKEKAGYNFLEYLTKVRIEKSKLLLKDLGFKIYQISDMVGYDSPKYFSKLFKSYTGMTPKEYRNSMR